jgi:hypothetical protein
MLKAEHGRDGEFGSTYMKRKLDDFPWQDRGLEKPTIHEFSRWAMSTCKNGLNLNDKRKSSKPRIIVQKSLKEEIVKKAEAITGKIQDSFLGSPKYIELYEEFRLKYEISEPLFAKILISKRKKTPSRQSGEVYAYIPAPKTRPLNIKFGFTGKENPYERMEDETKNTRTEIPQMIGWFHGSKEDEKRVINYFEKHKVKGCGNREMFEFINIKIPIGFMREEIKKYGGQLDNSFLEV